MNWEELIKLCTNSTLIKEDLLQLGVTHEVFLEALNALKEIQEENLGSNDPSFFILNLPKDQATREYIDWLADVENSIRANLFKILFIQKSINSLKVYPGFDRFIKNLCTSQGMVEQLYGTIFLKGSELEIVNIEEESPEADVKSRIGDNTFFFHITGVHSRIGFNHFQFCCALRTHPRERDLRNTEGEQFYILPDTKGHLPIAQGRPIVLTQIIFDNQDERQINESIPSATPKEFVEKLANKVMDLVVIYLEGSAKLESAEIKLQTQRSDKDKQLAEYSFTIYFSNIYAQSRTGYGSPTNPFKFLAGKMREKEAKLTDKESINILIYTLEGRGTLDEGVNRGRDEIEKDIMAVCDFDAVFFLNTTIFQDKVSIKRSRFFSTQKTTPELIKILEDSINKEIIL